MKEIKLYLSDELFGDIIHTEWNKAPIFRILKVVNNKEIWGTPLYINGKFYRICMAQGDNYAIREMEYYKYNDDIDELGELNEDNIKCPICGYEESDCWEYSEDEEDEHICCGCGSTLSWQREYTVAYNVTVKNINNFIKVE